jgi:hypothetical protein
MKRKLLYLSTFLTVMFFLIINACQKDSSSTANDESPYNINSVEKNVVDATATFDELNSFAQSGFESGVVKGLNSIGSCPAVGVNFFSVPFSVTLDWGTGCTGNDGITRSGKITLSLSGMMNEKNSVATMKIENFTVDNKKISGVTKITYVGLNAGNNWPRYSVVTEGKIEFADNSVISYRSEYVRLQSEGSGTLSILDDTWRIEGTANGVHRDGTKWTAKTTKVMIRKGDCKWFGSGTLVITPEKGDVKTIDFGDGACDNKATMKIGEKITEITI